MPPSKGTWRLPNRRRSLGRRDHETQRPAGFRRTRALQDGTRHQVGGRGGGERALRDHHRDARSVQLRLLRAWRRHHVDSRWRRHVPHRQGEQPISRSASNSGRLDHRSRRPYVAHDQDSSRERRDQDA